MRLLPIAILASWLAQNVAAEIPNKYLSVGLLSIVCQNDVKTADEDFYVFSKEGDGWISIVGNVTSIHETAEGFTLKLSNSPHETSFLKRTDEGYSLVNFDKGELSKRVCTDLTLLSAALKKSMFDLADKAYAAERQADSTEIDDLKLRLQLLQTKNAEQDNALAVLAARSATERTAASGTIASLNNDLRAWQTKNAGLKADLIALNERYEAERLSASDTIGNLKADLLALQSENASQQKDLAALTDRYDSDSAASAGEIAGLKVDLTALNERYAEERTITAGTIEKLKIETRNYKQIISKSTQTVLILENSLMNSQNALEKIYGMKSQPNGEAADELTLNIKLYSEALTNAMQNMSELRTEFVNLEIIFGQEADLLALQSENASQQKDLAALTDRYDSDSATSAGEIAVLRANLLETQTQNAGQQAKLTDLTARYDGLRAKSTATIDDLQDKSRLLQAKINAQEARLESLSAESSGYQNALLAATEAIAELRAELSKTREAAAKAKAALEQHPAGLKKRLAAALAQKLADDAELEDVRAKLAAALAAKLAAERSNADQMTEAETRAALLSEAQKTLSKEKAISAKARGEMALLNQQVAALRNQLQNLQGLLDDAMAKDIAEEVQLQNLGSQLNSALARVAAEERKRRRLEEAEHKRLKREALELQGRTEQLSYQAKDLEKYRSEFFGRLRDVLGQQEGVRIVGDRFVFASEVLFPPGGANLSSAGKQEVAKVAKILASVAKLIPEEINWIIRVDGHTDDTKIVPGGRFSDNWHLSQARALSVVRYFANKLDIPPNRLAANGFGEYQPVNTENTPEARAQNRRIELKLTEK